MPKILKLLEEKVEWFAIGLGGLWLIWVVLAYVLAAPVTLELRPGKVERPGTIDLAIREDPVKRLEAALQDRPALDSPRTDAVENFVAAMHGRKQAVELAGTMFNSQPQVTPIAKPQVEIKSPTTTEVVATGKAELPTVPAPTLAWPPQFGRTYIRRPAPGAAPAPAPAGGPAPAVPVVEEDKDWFRLFLKWDDKAYLQAMVKAGISDAIRQQLIVVARVEVQREEQTATGWSERKTIAVLPSPKGFETAAPPQAAQDIQRWMEYVRQGQDRIMRPQFHDIVAGQDPDKPDADAPKPILAPVTPQPAPPKVKPPVRPTPPKPPRSGRGSRDGDRYFIDDELAVRQWLDGQALAQAVPPRRPIFNPDEEGEMPGRPGGWAPPGGGATVPPNLAAMPQFAHFWAWDDSVEEGKTYRYRVRLVLINPLYGALQEVKKADLAQVVMIPADAEKGWCDWSPGVTVPDRTEFFVVSAPMVHPVTGHVMKNTVGLEVYRFERGKVMRTKVEVGPGDPVGLTLWSVVDIRPVRNWLNTQVILADRDFQTRVQLHREDLDSARRKQLSAVAVDAAAALAP